jgi:hypothetical protein
LVVQVVLVLLILGLLMQAVAVVPLATTTVRPLLLELAVQAVVVMVERVLVVDKILQP